MKPKFRRFVKRALPALIIVPAMMQAASAATILPDGFGNVLITTADSGAHNIQTGFGGPPPAGAHEIRIDAGASITPAGGDAVEIQVSNASGATYTINNNGTLSANPGAPGQHGIDTIDMAGFTPSITVNNTATGTISGFSGIRANNLLTLDNAGTIQGLGFSDGAVFTKNGGSVTNSGTISGNVHGIESDNPLGNLIVNNTGSVTAANGTGIISDGTVNVTNGNTWFDTATISGLQDGINAGGPGSTVGNDVGSTITGGLNGVVLGTGAVVTNTGGTITGSGADGVVVGNGSAVNNLEGTIPFGIQEATITGSNNGVTGGDGVAVVNESTITGTNGTGVYLDDNASVTNSGIITGAVSGVRVSDNSTVGNSGTITGNLGIDVFAGGGTFVLNNSGTITGTGGTAIDGALFGDDTFNLNAGSIINGDILGQGGYDTFNLTSSGAGNVVVNGDLNAGNGGSETVLDSSAGGSINVFGDVLGGFGTDTIAFVGGKTLVGGATNVIHGDVTLNQSITKDGAGTAFIGDVGEFVSVGSDSIAINGGGLYINGDINPVLASQTVITANGAGLGGTGTWDAVVAVNAGGISAGQTPINIATNPIDSVGTLTITGDVTHAPGSFIRYDVRPQGAGGDLIVQTGVGNVYDVNGANLRLSSTNVNQALSNGTYTVVASDELIANYANFGNVGIQFNQNIVDNGSFVGSQSGDFSGFNQNTVLTNFFVTTALADGGTNLVFNVQHNYAGLPGLSGNEASLGSAIDASVSSGDPLIQDFIAALDHSDLGTVQSTLASLNPEGVLGLTVGIMNTNYRLHRLAQDHLATVRSSGETITETVPATHDAKGGVVAAQTTTTTVGGRGNVWGTASYDWQDYQGATSVRDYDGETGSFTAGFDYRVAPEFVIGLMLDGSTSDYDGTGNSSDVDSLRAAIYGTWGASTGIYSDFLVGYGDHDIDQSRVLGGILGGIASGSTDATSVQALWTVGYAFGDERVKHGPFAGLEYQNVDVDGYSQTGALPVSVGGYDVDSLRGLIGYRVNANLGTFRPYASVAYAHEFKDDVIRTSAVFGGIGGAAFGVSGPELGSAILLSAGTGIGLTNSLTLDVGYRGEISVDDGIDSHGGSLGLNYSF